MQVVNMQGTHAVCESDGKQELIDMILVGEQKSGTWILNFLGAAREVLTEENAHNIRQALTAMTDIMQGEVQIEHLFADLIDREPELPPHLHEQMLKHTSIKES